MNAAVPIIGGQALERPDLQGKQVLKVLLVEDNVGFAYGIRHILLREHRGRFECVEVHALGEAHQALASDRFDVILLDLGLPDSVRIATFSRTQAHAADTPVIILTVLDDDAVAMEAMRCGAQDYLVKDHVDSASLVRAIRYAVERARVQRELHDLSSRLLRVQDEERRRIAQELHDTTAQQLAALSMNLSLLNAQAEELQPPARKLLHESIAGAEECARQLRTVSYLLHPPLLEEIGLEGVVRDYADGFATRSGIRVDLEIPQRVGRLAPAAERALFRILQESLTNIHRHSGSRTASIRLVRLPAEVQLQVADSGRGMPPAALRGGEGAGLGVGIAGMRERVRQLGGRLEIASGDKGTCVTAVLPVVEAPA